MDKTCIDGIHGMCERERKKDCRTCPFYKEVIDVKLLGTQTILKKIIGSNISLNRQQIEAIEEALNKFNN